MSDTRTVEIYLAGLIPLISQAQTDVNVDVQATAPLSLWLTRARCDQVAETELLRQFMHGINIVSDTASLPLAALSYYYHNDSRPAYVLYVDPVHLKPDRDQLILFGPNSLSLGLAEAQLLLQDLEKSYQDMGWKFACHSASSWMLVLHSDPETDFSPLSSVIGKSVRDYLPMGSNSRHWQMISNEIQMLLHDHPSNLAREQSSHLAVNSVWFWGGGSLQTLRLPAKLPTPVGQLWTDNSCASGLAKLIAMPVSELPADADRCIEALSQTVRQKIFIDLDEWCEISNDSLSSGQKLKALHEAWLVPLINAVADQRVEQVKLYDDFSRCFTIDRKRLKHWWKRARPLSTFL